MPAKITLLPLESKEVAVAKADPFVMARYTLSLNEARVIWACLSKIDFEKKIQLDTEIRLTADEARKLFYGAGNAGNIYRDLTDACDKLLNRKIEIQLNEDELLVTRIVASVQFNSKSKHVILSFAPKILPYISDLRDGYTRTLVDYTRNFTSFAAFRFYDLMQMQLQNGSNVLEISIERLRYYLQLDDKYQNFADFRRRIIEPALNQINEYTELTSDVTYEKRNGYAQFDTAIFHIKRKKVSKKTGKPQKIAQKKPRKTQKEIDF